MTITPQLNVVSIPIFQGALCEASCNEDVDAAGDALIWKINADGTFGLGPSEE